MSAKRKRWVGVLTLITLSLLTTISRADVVPEIDSVDATESRSPSCAEVQSECRSQILRIERELHEIKAARSAEPPVLLRELDYWQQLELVTQQRKSIQKDLERQRKIAASGAAADQTPDLPGSFLEVDELRNTIDSRLQSLQALELELQSEKSLTSESRTEFENAEHERRRLHDELKQSDETQRLARQRLWAMAELKSRVLMARLDANREQVALLTSRVEVASAQLAAMQSMEDATKGRFRLTRAELELRLQVIADREAEVRAQLAAVDAKLRAAMYAGGDRADEDTRYVLAREESQVLRQLLSGAGQLKQCWRQRFLLSNEKASASDVKQWLEQAEQSRQRIEQIGKKLELRARQRQESLALLQRSASLEASDDGTVSREREELQRVIEFYAGTQALVVSGERLYQRLIEDLEARQDSFSLVDNRRSVQSSIASAWRYEITSIDDEPITVAKLICGLALLLVGYFLSRWMASWVAYRVLPRFGVSESAAAVLRTVLFYSLLVTLALFSLDVVNVPLTVFAFLGGAVAIGVGFGSQNLINNFISGLILLVERPIRVGDLVNVDGIDANVEHVGARSTRVRTGENLEIIVPNSKFLESNVTNWTLSDTRIRTSVTVGVAYGTPVRDVIEILHRVIRQTEGAFTTPEPIVLFKDFADSSLNFEAHFWVHQRRMMDGAKIRSEVRVAIDDAFRDAEITIAFPQCDVHLDMQSPLEVKLADQPDVLSRSSTGRGQIRRAA